MSNPGRPWKCGLFAVAAVFMLAWSPLRVPAEEYRSPADGIQSMEYAEGRLSLEARDASLDKVLRELSRMAKLTIIADGPVEGRITLHADHLPLEKALRKILRGIDTSFVYTAKAETSPKEYEIKQVRIYVSNGEKGETRRYSSASSSREREERRSTRPPPRPGLSPQRRGPGPPPVQVPRLPEMATSDEAKRLLSALMEGNLDGLDEIAEKLKAANPQAEEQIDEFLESLEETRRRAEESGSSIPPLEQLGKMRNQINRILRQGRMSPGQEPE